MSKRVNYGVCGVMVAIAAALAGVAGHHLGQTRESAKSNLAYTEQVDYLLRVAVYRLQRGDARADVLDDLRLMSANYNVSYEGQQFWGLMATYMERDVRRPELFHLRRPPGPPGRQFKPEELSPARWTLFDARKTETDTK